MKHKTELKRAFDSEHEVKLTATNKDYTGEWEFKPADLNKDGMEAQLEVECKCIPNTAGWEGKAEFKVGGFGAGPVKAYTELQMDSNDKKEHVATFSQNLSFDGGYQTAVKVEADVGKTSGVKNVNAILAATGQSWGSAWAGANITSKWYYAGFATNNGPNQHYVAQANYDGSKGAKNGVFGMPLHLRAGSVFHLENNSKLHIQESIGQEWLVKSKWEVPVDKTWKFTFSEKMDLYKMMKNEQASYKAGFSLEMKL